MKQIQVVTMTALLLAIFTLPAFGREITLNWEPSPSSEIIGYKIYYQQGSPQLPLAGTDADQGPSPIDVENSVMATISGLQESVDYYFSVTAYDSNYNESTFSKIVSTAWMPPLRTPQKESIVIPWDVTFQWDAGPAEDHLNYTLFYSTDKSQVIYAQAAPSSFVSFPNTPWPIPTQGLLIVTALLLMLTMLSAAGKRDRRIVYLRRAAVSGLLVFSLVACGGSGGSGWTDENGSLSATAVTSVNTGSSTSYQADNLDSGTTYYWKVDAQSTTEPDTVYHSEVYSFTTQ